MAQPAQNQVMDYILLSSRSPGGSDRGAKGSGRQVVLFVHQAEGRLKVNPTETLASPKVGKSLPKPDSQEIDELLTAG
jgi:site-specific recombinase XerC